MRLEHSFTVPVPVDAAWEVLLDLERIAPCMPGATLTGVEDDTFTGTVKVKLGPINLMYQGKGRFVERDQAARRVVVEASGRDTRSAGTASATVTSTLTPEDDATRVDVVTDLAVTGRPAQFGRGMIADVSGKLIGQFSDCLAETLTGPEPAPLQEEPAEPIDLLKVTGQTETARRLAVYGLAALLAVLAWLILRRRRR
jgi:carbon monoxide dehydrogenase subunit G